METIILFTVAIGLPLFVFWGILAVLFEISNPCNTVPFLLKPIYLFKREKD